MTKLKTIRKRQKLRLRQVAERLGLTPQTVWAQEKNGVTKVSTAERYAPIFNCNPLDLLEL